MEKCTKQQWPGVTPGLGSVFPTVLALVPVHVLYIMLKQCQCQQKSFYLAPWIIVISYFLTLNCHPFIECSYVSFFYSNLSSLYVFIVVGDVTCTTCVQELPYIYDSFCSFEYLKPKICEVSHLMNWITILEFITFQYNLYFCSALSRQQKV